VLSRRSERIAINATGSLRTSRGMQWDIPLADLSEGGCRVEDEQGRLRLGEYVRFYIGGTGPHMAEVAWRQGSRVGIEFVRPLPQRVFQKLAAADWDGARCVYEEERGVLPVRRMI
jgi:hypothetical protein